MEKKFTVLHDDNGVFVDKSFNAKDFGNTPFNFVPIALTDFAIDATFGAALSSSENADWGDGQLIAQAFSGEISGGWAVLANGRRLRYENLANMDSVDTGTFVFKIKLGYSGNPSSHQRFIEHSVSAITNRITIRHLSSGELLVDFYDKNDFNQISKQISYNPTAGDELEIMICWDLRGVSDFTNIYLNKVKNATLSSTGIACVRDSNILDERTQFYADNGVNAGFSIKDLMYFSTVKETGASYTTDYAVPIPKYAIEDQLYVGLYKPFNSFYVELNTANTNANTITAEYYDKNDGWTNLPITDNTVGLTLSGFITWNTPKDSNFNLLEEETEIDSKILFWVRLTFSADHSAGSKIQGLAPLFSCDKDLIEERSNIASSTILGDSLSSWILKHQAARKHIIQEIRNRGNVKFRFKKDNLAGTDDTYEHSFANITEFDILNFDDVRQASKYLALSKIMHQELSDKTDDKYSSLGNHFFELYEKAFALFFLQIDLDDDGEVDEEDQASENKTIALTRD